MGKCVIYFGSSLLQPSFPLPPPPPPISPGMLWIVMAIMSSSMRRQLMAFSRPDSSRPGALADSRALGASSTWDDIWLGSNLRWRAAASVCERSLGPWLNTVSSVTVSRMDALPPPGEPFVAPLSDPDMADRFTGSKRDPYHGTETSGKKLMDL